MYVIIGANGFLGAYCMRQILQATQNKILAVDMTTEGTENCDRVEWFTCSITNIGDIERLNQRIAGESCCKVIYLAAYHNPDAVKKNPKIAWNINITSLSLFLNAMDNVECLFYPSTEMVYGEASEGTAFTEGSLLNPVNVYGKHKVVAEALVTAYGYNVVRFPFLIGPSLLSNKKHFYDVIVDTISKGQTIEMFVDSYKSALDFGTAAELLIQLMQGYSKAMPQIINLSGDEVLSKYDIGLRIARKYGCDESLILPISMENDAGIFTEKRAGSAILDNTLLKRVLGVAAVKLKI